MGYFKENFPGSPAYYLRRKIAVGGVVYSVVVGGLLFLFSPYAKRIVEQPFVDRDDLTPQWVKDRKKAFSRRKHDQEDFIPTPAELRSVDRLMIVQEGQNHSDFTRPRKWELAKKIAPDRNPKNNDPNSNGRAQEE